MADETHIEWLLDGRESWNARRVGLDFEPNFWSADIYGAFRKSGKLSSNGEVSLARYNLEDAVFRGANLSNVNFGGSNLRRVKFSGARFSNTVFFQVDLRDAEFSVGSLQGASLASAQLEGTELRQTNLTGVNLGWSRLWQAKLYPELDGSGDFGWHLICPRKHQQDQK